MSFELFVALRYLFARRKQAFISLISLISMIGVCVGVIALVISASAMTSAITPTVTPSVEINEMTEMNACLRRAIR